MHVEENTQEALFDEQNEGVPLIEAKCVTKAKIKTKVESK